MLRRLVTVSALFLLAAPPVLAQTRQDQKDIEWEDAAKTPLRDLNVMPEKIPQVLRDAQADAYRPPRQMSCRAIAGEIQGLEDVLGDDFDAPPPPPPTKEEKRTGTANVVLKGAAASIVPFRGWVRQLTGAERHARAVHTAIAAGRVRRAYLKGLGQSIRCRWPAAPWRPPPPPGRRRR
jgi:hypothetical protein